MESWIHISLIYMYCREIWYNCNVLILMTDIWFWECADAAAAREGRLATSPGAEDLPHPEEDPEAHQGGCQWTGQAGGGLGGGGQVRRGTGQASGGLGGGRGTGNREWAVRRPWSWSRRMSMNRQEVVGGGEGTGNREWAIRRPTPPWGRPWSWSMNRSGRRWLGGDRE